MIHLNEVCGFALLSEMVQYAGHGKQLLSWEEMRYNFAGLMEILGVLGFTCSFKQIHCAIEVDLVITMITVFDMLF
jgi:hypothetical protein